jgi:hypothetical protein
MNDPVSQNLIHSDSLADTLDSVHAALYERIAIPDAERLEAAQWIADRQGLPGSYAGMFAPTEKDYAFGAHTFTGEPVRSGAGTGHILSEESCRALYLLDAASDEVRDALMRARQGIFRRLEQSEVEGKWSGVYCCATCSVALWRHLSASGEPDDSRRLENGMRVLKNNRDGKGRWKRFPFFYTLLALSEMESEHVRNETLYALPVIERALRRAIKSEPETMTIYERRRMIMMERLLERC